MYYNNVYNSGITGNVGYLSVNVELLTLKYTFFNMMPVPLCSSSLVAASGNAGDCPANGAYGFSVNYKLPTAGSGSTSWLATGWAGSGTFKLYAQNDLSMLIGQCSFNLKTYVTPSPNRSTVPWTPSAAAATGITLGVLAFIALGCLYCSCCRARRRLRAAVGADKKPLDEDTLAVDYKKLEESKTVEEKLVDDSIVEAVPSGIKDSRSVASGAYSSPGDGGSATSVKGSTTSANGSIASGKGSYTSVTHSGASRFFSSFRKKDVPSVQSSVSLSSFKKRDDPNARSSHFFSAFKRKMDVPGDHSSLSNVA